MLMSWSGLRRIRLLLRRIRLLVKLMIGFVEMRKGRFLNRLVVSSRRRVESSVSELPGLEGVA